MLPFTVVHNGAPLLLTPVLASSAEADAELREVAVSLFHHVLPGVGRKFMRKLFADERARTILLMRSVEGASHPHPNAHLHPNTRAPSRMPSKLTRVPHHCPTTAWSAPARPCRRAC